MNQCLRLFRAPALLFGLTALGVTVLSSCTGGGSGSPSPPPPAPTINSVTVSPGSANLFVKATQQFTANVQGAGSFSSTVTWYVNDLQGGNATVGTITANGLYTAPSAVPSPGNITISAKSTQDTTKVGAAQVNINAENVQISISPTSGSTQLGSTLAFTATVTGTANTAVFWSVNNFPGGIASTGLIDQNGIYTAHTSGVPIASVSGFVAYQVSEVSRSSNLTSRVSRMKRRASIAAAP